MPWAWVGDNTIKMAKNGKKLLVGIGLVILIMISMQPQNTKKEGFINRYGYSSQAECESRIDDFSDPCKTSCNLITPDIFNCIDSNNIMRSKTSLIEESLVVGEWNGLSLNSGSCSNLGQFGSTDEATLYQCFVNPPSECNDVLKPAALTSINDWVNSPILSNKNNALDKISQWAGVC